MVCGPLGAPYRNCIDMFSPLTWVLIIEGSSGGSLHEPQDTAVCFTWQSASRCDTVVGDSVDLLINRLKGATGLLKKAQQ